MTNIFNHSRRDALKYAGVLAGIAAFPLSSIAQAYPDRPTKILLGYSAGGTADVMLRLVAQQLSVEFSQPFVVENKPGASGNIAATQIKNSPADGYSLLFGNTAEMAVNKFFMLNTGFDVEKDFAPIALAYDVPLALVVSAASPYKSLDDLIEASKKPGSNITFASAGRGSPGHLAGEELAKRMNPAVAMTHVPYKGAAPALVDIIAGHVTYYFSGITAITEFIKAGSVRVLAVSSGKRTRFMKDTPTIAELTKSDFSFTLWGGYFAPAKTPPAIVQALNARINKIIMQPDITARMEREGSEATPLSPEAFAAFVKRETARYEKVVQGLGFKPE